MEYRFLGSTGLKASPLSFGSRVVFSDQIEKILDHRPEPAPGFRSR